MREAEQILPEVFFCSFSQIENDNRSENLYNKCSVNWRCIVLKTAAGDRERFLQYFRDGRRNRPCNHDVRFAERTLERS